MTPEFAKWLTELPLTVVLLMAVYKLYIDGKAYQALMIAKMDAWLRESESIKDRMTLIEHHLGIDDPATGVKRPEPEKQTRPEPS